MLPYNAVTFISKLYMSKQYNDHSHSLFLSAQLSPWRTPKIDALVIDYNIFYNHSVTIIWAMHGTS